MFEAWGLIFLKNCFSAGLVVVLGPVLTFILRVLGLVWEALGVIFRGLGGIF